MAPTAHKSLDFVDRGAWRAWLEAHHATKDGVWLRIARKHGSRLGLALAQAVEEALCFGWIDGALRPVDAECYVLRFSPRKAHSVWSVANKARAERLVDEGRMTEAGRAAIDAAKASGEWDAAVVRHAAAVVPDDLREALSQAGLGDAFVDWPRSRKEQYLHWIGSARRPATRARRVAETVGAVAERAKRAGARTDVLEMIRSGAAVPGEVAKLCASDSKALSALLAGLDARDAAAKFGCAKALRELSTAAPRALYGHFDRMAALLDGPNKILRWQAIRILGELAVVDDERKLDRMLDRYLAPIGGPHLIAAANAIQGAVAIARAKPYLAGAISHAILTVEDGTYETDECRNVVIGHALTGLDQLRDLVTDPDSLTAFARRQCANPRAAVARKARAFVERQAG